MPRCPVCDSWVPLFLPFGSPKRWRARCPRCGSLERQRLVALYLEDRAFFGGLGRVLESAPFPPWRPFLTQHAREVVTTDLYAPGVDVRADLQELPFPDTSFDTVICMHVLEHVDDDHAALSELRRVLRPAGRAILQVPPLANLDVTDEDPTVTDPAERLARFGQHDHVRTYGRDFVNRVIGAGFRIDEQVTAAGLVREPRTRWRFGLIDEDLLHVCSPA